MFLSFSSFVVLKHQTQSFAALACSVCREASWDWVDFNVLTPVSKGSDLSM